MATRRQQPLIDPSTDRRQTVNLKIAAQFLDMDPRTVRSRVDEGALEGWRDGKVYRVRVASIRAYHARRMECPT